MSDMTRRNLIGGIGAAAAAAAFVGTTGAQAAEPAAAGPAGWVPVDAVTIGGVSFRLDESVTVLLDDGTRRMGKVSETSENDNGDMVSALVELRFDGGAPPQATVQLQGPDGLTTSVLLVPNGDTVASVLTQKEA